MYKVIGADQKEYGPVSADELRQWIREGRADAQTRVQLQGTAEWRPLITFPEFAPLLGPAQPQPFSQPVYRPAPVSRGTNPMAVAGFVCSLLSFVCCVSWVLGLVFSGIGLRQINNEPTQGGKGFAIAGLAISIAYVLLMIVVLIIALLTDSATKSQFHF